MERSSLRKTRFVCVSDTHNAVAGGSFKLPKGDVLIHAGDLTNQGTYAELQQTLKWIEEADFEQKIVIAGMYIFPGQWVSAYLEGNHDITLDTFFYEQFGLYFHNQNPQEPTKCRQLLTESQSITYLNHNAAVIKLKAPDGPRTTFKIFGSPFSPAKGQWAFGYPPEEAAQLWDKIPLDVDITVTHTPPKYHCDESRERHAAGCEALRCMLWRVRPRLAICGHIHEARGAEIVRWDLGMANIKYKELDVERLKDPGEDNKKTSIFDLTSKGKRRLANDGSKGDDFDMEEDETRPTDTTDLNGKTAITFQNSGTSLAPSVVSKKSLVQKGLSQVTTSLLAIPKSSTVLTTRGNGGMPPSNRCDLEALSGRLGREETCVVNAAIMGTSWPHKKNGGKKFNKPVVVDIDLPCWEEDSKVVNPAERGKTCNE